MPTKTPAFAAQTAKAPGKVRPQRRVRHLRHPAELRAHQPPAPLLRIARNGHQQTLFHALHKAPL